MDWIQAHGTDIGLIVVAAYALISAVTRITPSTRDDGWVRRLQEIIALFRPHNIPGPPLSMPGRSPRTGWELPSFEELTARPKIERIESSAEREAREETEE